MAVAVTTERIKVAEAKRECKREENRNKSETDRERWISFLLVPSMFLLSCVS